MNENENENEKKHFIVDLDGTLAFDDHRRPLIKQEGWDAYFDALHLDTPNKDLIHMLGLFNKLSMWMEESQTRIHILTGRCSSTRSETEQWLTEHGVDCDSLLMRPEDSPYPDYSKPLSEQKFVTDKELKKAMLRLLDLTPENVIMVFDDRDDMVQWWRSLGYSCCQVRPQGVHFNPLTGKK